MWRDKVFVKVFQRAGMGQERISTIRVKGK